MPRETVHWEVLQAVAAKLAGTTCGTVLNENRSAAYLGAVAPDAPYHHRGGLSRLESVGERIHGSDGEDTLEVPRRLAALTTMLPEHRQRLALWSFLVGYLSHCAVDIVFHPMVYYHTGDYFNPNDRLRRKARANHRLFETYLDVVWGRKFESAPVSTVAELFTEMGPRFSVLCELMDRACDIPESGGWESSFRWYAFFQKRFLSNIWGAAVRFINLEGLSGLEPYDALFYYGRRRAELPFFDSEIHYRNPKSGKEHSEPLSAMRDRAVQLTLELVAAFTPLIEGRTNRISEPLSTMVGGSLNTGIPHTHRRDLKVFTEEVLWKPRD